MIIWYNVLIQHVNIINNIMKIIYVCQMNVMMILININYNLLLQYNVYKIVMNIQLLMMKIIINILIHILLICNVQINVHILQILIVRDNAYKMKMKQKLIVKNVMVFIIILMNNNTIKIKHNVLLNVIMINIIINMIMKINYQDLYVLLLMMNKHTIIIVIHLIHTY